jgi:hypothetical protein
MSYLKPIAIVLFIFIGNIVSTFNESFVTDTVKSTLICAGKGK